MTPTGDVVTVTVTDDDEAAVTVTVLTGLSVGEGGTGNTVGST